MLAVLSPTKLTEDMKNIWQFAEEWIVDCMLNAFLFCRRKNIRRINTMKQNVKQNKVHDEQIIVAKLRQQNF